MMIDTEFYLYLQINSLIECVFMTVENKIMSFPFLTGTKLYLFICLFCFGNFL